MRKIHFTKGFHYMGKIFAWHENALYQLPFESKLRFYGLRKCKPWGSGYYLGQHRKSKSQIEAMMTDIDESVYIFEDPDVPF